MSFKEYLIILKDICSLLKFQGKPLVRRVKGGFIKTKIWGGLPPLMKDVLSKGGFMKLAPGSEICLTIWFFFAEPLVEYMLFNNMTTSWCTVFQLCAQPRTGPVFTKILILGIFLRIVVSLRKILRIRIFLFTKIFILRITLILRIFLRMAFILRIFLRIRNCYMHKTLILDTESASKYRKSLLGLYSQWFLEIFFELHLV